MTETNARTGNDAKRPKPASGALPKAHDKLMVVGGEEAGTIETAVPAIVVRAHEVGENDSQGRAEGEYRADIVVLNAHGSAATPYTDVLVLGGESDAKAWLDEAAQPTRRTPEDASPARRALVAFWPAR